MRRDQTLGIFVIDGEIGDRHKSPIHQAVWQRAIVDAELHIARQIFPDTAGEKQSRRRDFAHVRGYRFRPFGKVDLHTGDQI